MDWLYSFDKPREPTSSAKSTPAKSVMHEQPSSQKKTIEKKHPLKQFDDFLSSIQTAPRPIDLTGKASGAKTGKELQDLSRYTGPAPGDIGAFQT